MAFSFRQPVQFLKDVNLMNDMCGVKMFLDIKKEFPEALQVLKAKFADMKGSLMPYYIYAVNQFVSNLPFKLPRALMDAGVDKYTMTFSNFNCSRIAFVLDGKKQLGQFYYGGVAGKLAFGATQATCGPYCSVAFGGDEAFIKNP